MMYRLFEKYPASQFTTLSPFRNGLVVTGKPRAD